MENQRDAMQPLVGTVCTLAKNQGAAGSPKLKVACLSALKEYVALCQKLKVLPTHLEDIEEVVLNNLDLSKGKLM